MSLFLDWQRALKDNPPQQHAFERQNHTVVIAGPGSGKTRVLALKVAQLLRDEIVPPQGIACLTYTRMMARELEIRLRSLGVPERENVIVGTMHSFCLGQVVQPFAELFDLGLPKPIRVAPSKVREQSFAAAYEQVYKTPYDPDEDRKTKEAFTRYRRQRADLPFDAWPDNTDIASLIQLYEQGLFCAGFVDFDSIVQSALRLISTHSLVRLSLQAKFPWFAVDEYQDLGYPLFRIVTEMIEKTSVKLFAIGDPAQSIFDFAGTDPKYLVQLSKHPDMVPTVVLEKNYRSAQEIIDISHAIIKPSGKHLSDTSGGACHVIECQDGQAQQTQEVINIVRYYLRTGVPPEEIAILHRWREGIKAIARALDAKHIPYHVDKHEWYDRTYSTIQWLEDLGYWCLRGWQGYTDKSAQLRATFDDLLETWLQFGHSPNLKFGADTNHARIYFAEILWGMRNSNLPLREWLDYVHKALDLGTLFEQYRQIYPDEVDEFYRLRDLSQADKALAALKLGEFANIEPCLQLTTLHSSKGTEFKVVIIVGVERIETNANGRRLLYVGITRAKTDICLLCTKTKPPWSRSRFPSLPPYIKELKAAQRSKHWTFFTYKTV